MVRRAGAYHPAMSGGGKLGAVLVLLLLLGVSACRDLPPSGVDNVGPTPPPRDELPGTESRTEGATAGAPSAVETTAPVPAAARPAFAVPNTGNGFIDLTIPDRPANCGALLEFPPKCEPAWRIRLSIPPALQRPGVYRLAEEGELFSYRDGQAPSGGAWVKGARCENTGGHFDGTLEISSIDPTGITGVLSGAGAADGPFRAERCAACTGTGMACSADAECCNHYCFKGRCQP
jgi:hypothetical protein